MEARGKGKKADWRKVAALMVEQGWNVTSRECNHRWNNHLKHIHHGLRFNVEWTQAEVRVEWATIVWNIVVFFLFLLLCFVFCAKETTSYYICTNAFSYYILFRCTAGHTGGDAKGAEKLGIYRKNLKYRAETMRNQARRAVDDIAEKMPF